MATTLVVLSINLLELSYSPILCERDLALMQGEWEPIFLEGFGPEVKASIYSTRFVIKGNRMIARGTSPDGRPFQEEAELRLHPLLRPKGVDFIALPNKDVIRPAIYDIGLHILVIKGNPIGMERPNDFTVPPDPPYCIMVMRRVK